MQTVFSNSMVAHVWAQQSQSEGRSNNGNLYFDGPVIYSYGSHFVAGYIDREGAAWINSDSYSPTTAKHMSYVSRAVRGKYFPVPSLTGIYRAIAALRGDCGATLRRAVIAAWIKRELSAYFDSHWQAFGPDSEAAAILWAAVSPRGTWAAERARREAAAAKAKAASAKAESKYRRGKAARFAELPLSMIRARMAEISNGASDWNRERLLGEYVTDLYHAHRAAGGARIKAAVWERLKLARTIKAREIYAPKARREARASLASLRRFLAGDFTRPAHFSDAAFDNAKAETESRHRRVILDSCHMPPAIRAAWRERLDSLFAEARRTSAIMDAERLAAQAAERAEWLAGNGPAYAYHLKGPRESALIRAERAEIDGCAVAAGELVTSQGARVPLSHAVRVFAFVRAVRERGGPWERKAGVGPRAGHFTVDSVERDGSFRAGCHYIAWEETERLARELGIWDCPATALAGEPDAEAA